MNKENTRSHYFKMTLAKMNGREDCTSIGGERKGGEALMNSEEGNKQEKDDLVEESFEGEERNTEQTVKISRKQKSRTKNTRNIGPHPLKNNQNTRLNKQE